MVEYVSPRGRDGLKKANTFAAFAKEYGWSSKVSKDGDMVRLFCRRGESESLEIQWLNGCVVPGIEPVYVLAGERITCRNLSAVSKIVQGEPDPKRLTRATRKLKRSFGIEQEANGPMSDADIDALRGTVPFDSESTDEELEAVLHKTTITWVNTISGQVDSSRVDVDRQFKIVRKNGSDKIKSDYITFCANEGYRAVYLKSIVAVAR